MKRLINKMLTIMLVTTMMIATAFTLPNCNKINASSHEHSGEIYDVVLDQAILESYYNDLVGGYVLPTGNYVLDADITLDHIVYIQSISDVKICLKGNTLNLGNKSINNEGTLLLTDCSSDEHYFTYNASTHTFAFSATETSQYTSYGLITGGYIKNAYDLILEKISIAGCNTENGALLHNGNKLEVESCEFIGNAAVKNGGAVTINNKNANFKNTLFQYNYAKNGGAVMAKSPANFYACSFFDNEASENGGALKIGGFVDSKPINAYFEACLLTGNKAMNGGAIYAGDSTYGNGITTMFNCQVSDNIATKNGGGIFVQKDTGHTSCCLVEGTKITMADGTMKNIEEVSLGDIVKTFDHETGTISSQEVIDVYKGEKKDNYFILHFTNGVDVSVHDEHGFLEKETLKYINISHADANDYVGKYFYNATAGRFEELLSVEYPKEKKEFYAITTAYDFNIISNEMLTITEDIVFLANIFDFDEDLSINQAKKQADIEKYGLVDRSEVPMVPELDFKQWKTAYYDIAVGKGYLTEAEKEEARQRAIEKYTDQTTTVVKGTSTNDYDTYTDGVDVGSLVIYSLIATGNKAGSKDNNVYLESDTIIRVIDGNTSSNVGVTLENKKGKFATKVYTNTLQNNFTSDNKSYEVLVKKVADEDYTYSLGNTVPETGVKGYNNYLIAGLALALIGIVVALAIRRKK